MEMSLVNFASSFNSIEDGKNYGYGEFSELFKDCSSLIKAPLLPVSSLTPFCYANMFRNCTNLRKTPKLSASVLGRYCYYQMFLGCTSLSNANITLASTLDNTIIQGDPDVKWEKDEKCCASMFWGCSSLVIPPILPATGLTNGCYKYMFAGCTNLRTPPALPATGLAKQCYDSMFQNCSSLTAVPQLPATEVKESCYHYMFWNCTSLSSASFATTGLTNYSYQGMFNGCSNLTGIEVAFNTWVWGINPTNKWVEAENGTFTKPASLPLSTGVNYIPEGWTVQNK